MKRACCIVSMCALALLIAYPFSSARGEKKDRVRYEKYKPDSVLKEMREEKDSLQALNDSITAEIDADWKKIKKIRIGAIIYKPFTVHQLRDVVKDCLGI